MKDIITEKKKKWLFQNGNIKEKNHPGSRTKSPKEEWKGGNDLKIRSAGSTSDLYNSKIEKRKQGEGIYHRNITEKKCQTEGLISKLQTALHNN